MTSQYSLTAACERGDVDRVRALIEAGHDPNCLDDFGRLGLTAACRGGHLGCVRMLLELGADANAVEREDAFPDEGRSPLAAAAEMGHLEVVELLLSVGARAETEESRTPLALAAENGHTDVLRLVAATGVELDRPQGFYERTALGEAAVWGQGSAIVCLLDLGANPTRPDVNGVLPLGAYCGSVSGDRPSRRIIELLVGAGSDVDGQAEFGGTALHSAARWSGAEPVRALLELGADPHRLNDQGRTPLHEACEADAADEVVSILVSAGADVDLRDQDSRQPLHIACGNAAAGAAAVKPLVDAGADVDALNANGRSPLRCALQSISGTVSIRANKAGLLLDRGADPNGSLEAGVRWGDAGVGRRLLALGVADAGPGSAGFTALHWAAYDGHAEVVEVLAGAGFDLESIDRDANRPLHLACQEQHVDVALALLRAGASLGSNNRGRSPLFYGDQKTRETLLAALPRLAECLTADLDEVRAHVSCTERGEPSAGCGACSWQPAAEQRLHCPWCEKHGLVHRDHEVLHGNPATPASDTDVQFTYGCEHCGLAFHGSYNIFAMASPSLTEAVSGALWSSEDGVRWRRLWQSTD